MKRLSVVRRASQSKDSSLKRMTRVCSERRKFSSCFKQLLFWERRVNVKCANKQCKYVAALISANRQIEIYAIRLLLETLIQLCAKIKLIFMLELTFNVILESRWGKRNLTLKIYREVLRTLFLRPVQEESLLSHEKCWVQEMLNNSQLTCSQVFNNPLGFPPFFFLIRGIFSSILTLTDNTKTRESELSFHSSERGCRR